MILYLGTTPAVQRTMTFDGLEVDAVNRAVGVTETASGKAVNAARVGKALGAEGVVTGFVGGEPGRALRHDLDRGGVRHDFVEVKPKTRVCVTLIDRDEGTATELVEEPGEVDPRDYETLFRVVEVHLKRATALVCGGSLAPGGTFDFYARCVRAANALNVPSVVDATGAPLARAAAERPLVVKPNLTELADTTGVPIDSPATLREAIKQVVGAGPQWVVVTAGPQPVVVSDGSTHWAVTVPEVDVVSPIGSGDALAAGIAVALTQGKDVPEAVRLGVACGAANAMNAAAGFVRRDDVDQLLGDIQVQKISLFSFPGLGG